MDGVESYELEAFAAGGVVAEAVLQGEQRVESGSGGGDTVTGDDGLLPGDGDTGGRVLGEPDALVER